MVLPLNDPSHLSRARQSGAPQIDVPGASGGPGDAGATVHSGRCLGSAGGLVAAAGGEVADAVALILERHAVDVEARPATLLAVARGQREHVGVEADVVDSEGVARA